MNPENKLKTPAGYNGRTSAAAYDLGFEFATRGVIKGFQATAEAGRKVRLASTDGKRSIAVAYDGKEKAGVYMDVDDFVAVGLKKLPTDCWHTVVAIVKATPTGTAAQPDNPESVAIFDIEGQAARPMEDAEVADYVATSTALGAFQGGKWCTLCKAFVAGNAESVGEILPGAGAETALPITVSKTTSGRYVEITDAAFAKLVSYRIDGQTIQDGIPAPDAPVELMSDSIATVQGTGKNLSMMDGISGKMVNFYYVENKILDNYKLGQLYCLEMDINIGVTPFRLSYGTGTGEMLKDLRTVTSLEGGHFRLCFTITDKEYPNLFIRCPRYTSPTTTNYTIENIMLYEVASEDETRPYEPPKGGTYQLSAPIELRSVGDVRDSIEKRDGVWGVMRRTTKTIFDEKIQWGISGVAHTSTVYANYPRSEYLKTHTEDWMNDRFEIYENYNALGDRDVIGAGINPNFGSFGWKYAPNAERPASVAEVAAYFKAHPVTAIYPADAPTFEPLPDADQAIFENLHSFSPTTILATQGTQTIEYITAQMQPILDNLPTLPVEVTSIDPGEGVPLAPGKLIGVYKAS